MSQIYYLFQTSKNNWHAKVEKDMTRMSSHATCASSYGGNSQRKKK